LLLCTYLDKFDNEHRGFVAIACRRCPVRWSDTGSLG
jgi:hypothetical protein